MHKSRSQFLFISLCGRKRTAALESQYMISFSTRIDCRMRSLKTLGKSAHHFSVTPLSWVLKGEFSLILSICESISLCSQVTFQAIYTFIFQTGTYTFGWAPTSMWEWWGWLCGSWKSQQQWRMKFPRISCSLGKSSCQWWETALVLPLSHPRWTSSAQAWNNMGFPNSTQICTQAK